MAPTVHPHRGWRRGPSFPLGVGAGIPDGPGWNAPWTRQGCRVLRNGYGFAPIRRFTPPDTARRDTQVPPYECCCSSFTAVLPHFFFITAMLYIVIFKISIYHSFIPFTRFFQTRSRIMHKPGQNFLANLTKKFLKNLLTMVFSGARMRPSSS